MEFDAPEKPDLSAIVTDDLINELMARCETVVIAREYQAKQGNAHKTLIEYSGSMNAAIGLIARATRVARRWAADDED